MPKVAGASDVSFANDPYPIGQCTYYIAGRYPSFDTIGNMGNAKDWAANARAKGLSVLQTPKPGTIMVLGPYSGGISADGHVAVVEDVRKDGSLLVSDMNWAGDGGGWNIIGQHPINPANVNVLGYIVPHELTGLSGYTDTSSGNAASADCISSISIFGTTMCMDGLIGGSAIALGAVLMLAGATMLLVIALHAQPSQEVLGAAVPLRRPLRYLAARPEELRTRREQTASQANVEARRQAQVEHEEGLKRAQLRQARAKARGEEARARNLKVVKAA